MGGLAAGAAILWPALARPAAAPAWPETSGAARRLLSLTGVALLLLGLVALLSQAAALTGLSWADAVLDGVVARLATQTRYGQLWLVRMGLLAVLLAVLVAAWRRPPRLTGGGPGRRPRLAEWVGFEIGALYLLALAAGGHARRGRWRRRWPSAWTGSTCWPVRCGSGDCCSWRWCSLRRSGRRRPPGRSRPSRPGGPSAGRCWAPPAGA